jgi:glycosyltransferase involved in cell wall biosynthesis
MVAQQLTLFLPGWCASKRKHRSFKERRNLAIADSIETEILKQHHEHHFDAVYERYSLWSAAGMRAARKLGIPSVVEVNAPLLLEQRSYRRLVLEDEARAIEKEVFTTADVIVAVSDEVAAYVRAQAGVGVNVVTIPNGVDLEAFTPSGPSADTGFVAGLPVIGFSGSLKAWHGIEDLMAAHSLLRAENMNCGLLFVGDGPMSGWIEGYVEGAGIERLVKQTGWISHSAIPSYIRSMDIAVAPYPKLQDFYFSPLKLFEYMACGRAVVASGIGQIKNVITHGVNGMMYDPGDVRGLADALKILLSDQSKRESLGKNGVEEMRGRSWLDAASSIVNLVNQHDLSRRRAS